MDYRKLSMLQRSTKRKWSVLELDEESELINIKDITKQKDDADTEIYVSQVLMGALLENFLFKVLIIVVIVSNCIITAFQTNDIIAKKYDIAFSVCEHIILTVFIWEILVKWYYGFNIFWRNGWNILDCVVTLALILGPMIFPKGGASLLKIIRVLRVIRSVRGFASMQGVAMMVQVIMQSIPDMANIFLLLVIIMLVFAVFGVTLFSAAVPSAFGDLSSALYTLFICITQDGWVAIYKQFEDGDDGLMYGASLYFFVFLTGGAFIFANLLVAVVTTNLEISMADYDDKSSPEGALASTLMPEDVTVKDQRTIHMEEVITKTNMTQRQRPCRGSCLENLTVDTFEELALVMSAIQKNMSAYREIRQELEHIVKEVHSLSFNREQEQEVIMRNQRAASLQDSLLKNDVAMGRTGDMLSTLITLEKAHVIDSGTAQPALFQKGMMRHAAKRMSISVSADRHPSAHRGASGTGVTDQK